MASYNENDLSEYELVRLRNIRRNNELLSQLGFREPKEEELEISNKKLSTAKKIISRKRPNVENHAPTRKSTRLSGGGYDNTNLPSEETIAKSPTKSVVSKIDYDSHPVSSDELDDFEFEVYAILRGWRLRRCRELDIEPFKIFQNRTLVEIIRFKRNDENWGENSPEDTNKQIFDLLQVWGKSNILIAAITIFQFTLIFLRLFMSLYQE